MAEIYRADAMSAPKDDESNEANQTELSKLGLNPIRPGVTYYGDGMNMSVRSQGAVRMNAGEGITSADPLDNAVTATGVPIARSQVTEDSRVTYQGINGRVRELVSMGLLRPAVGGSFEWIAGPHAREARSQSSGQGAQQTQQQQESESEKDDPDPAESSSERLSDASETIMGNALKTLGAAPMRALIETTVTGGDPEAYVNEFASRLSVKPEEARAQIASVQAEFTEQARNAVGFDEDTYSSFSEWALSERTNEAHEAMRRQVEWADLEPLKKLARVFMASGNAYDAESVLNAELGGGITARRDSRSGKVLLTIPGRGTMSFDEALQNKIISVQRI